MFTEVAQLSLTNVQEVAQLSLTNVQEVAQLSLANVHRGGLNILFLISMFKAKQYMRKCKLSSNLQLLYKKVPRSPLFN